MQSFVVSDDASSLQRINAICCFVIDCFDIDIDFAFFSFFFLLLRSLSIGPISSSARSLNSERDQNLHLASTNRFFHDTIGDKEQALLSQNEFTTTTTLASLNKEKHASSIAKVYESDLDETQNSTQLISIKSIENSPYDFSLTNMSTITDSTLVNYRPNQQYKPEHYTQTDASDFYDHSTNTLDDIDDGYDSSSRFNSKSTSEKYLTPTKYRAVARLPLRNILLYTGNGLPKQYDDEDDDMVNFGDKIIIPTKYRLRQERINRLLANENRSHSRQPLQTAIEQDDDYEQRQSENEESPVQKRRPGPYEERQPRKRTQPVEEPVQQKRQQLPLSRGSSPEQPEPHYEKIDLSHESTRSRDGSQSSVRQQPSKRTQPVEEPVREKQQQQQQSNYQPKHQLSERPPSSRESSPEQPQNHHHESDSSPKPIESRDKSTIQQQHSSRSNELDQSRKRTQSVEEPVRQKPQQRIQSSRDSSSEPTQIPVKSVHESVPPQQQQTSRQQVDSDDEILPKQSQQSRKGQAENQDPPIRNLTSPKPSSNYEQRTHRNGFRQGSSPPPSGKPNSNYYELEVTPQRNGSMGQSPPLPLQSKQQRIDSGDTSEEEQSEYFGQAPSQNRNTTMQNLSTVPSSKQHSNYEPRVPPHHVNESSNKEKVPREEGESNYYELELSPERNTPLRESSSFVRQRTNSGNESLEKHSQYYGQAPIQNTKTSTKNIPPPVEESQARARSGNELTNRSPSSSQQQQQQHSNYYGLDRSSKRTPSSQEPSVRQHQSSYEEQQQPRRRRYSPRRTSTPPTAEEQVHQPNGSTQKRSHSPAYNGRRVGAQATSNHRSPTRHHQERHISRRNNDRDPLNLLYNRYRIIDGDFELRENPPNGSQSRQIQFLFKALLQGRDSQEGEDNDRDDLSPARTYSRHASDASSRGGRNRASPSNDDTPHMNGDDRNENPTGQSDGRRTNRHQFSSITLSPRSAQRNARLNENNNPQKEDSVSGSRASPDRRQENGDSPRTHTPIPTNENDQVIDQAPVDAQPARPVHIDDDSHTSPKTPPRPSLPRSKYYFGKNVDYSVSDDDSDGADCQMFGHAPQSRSLNNTTTRRNLDYSSTTNPRFPPDSNNTSSVDARFAYQNTTGTTIDDRITHQQERSPSPPHSTDGRTDHSIPNWQSSTSRSTSQRVDRQASDDYINTTNYIDLNQNFSNTTTATVGFPRQHSVDANNYEENRENTRKQQPPSNQFPQQKNDRKQSHDDDDQDDSPDDDDDDDDDDIHDQVQNNHGDATYINEIDDDDNDSQHSSVPQIPSSSSVNELLRQNPVRDVPATFRPAHYSPSPPIRQPGSVSTTGKPTKKSGGGFFGLFRGSKKKNQA